VARRLTETLDRIVARPRPVLAAIIGAQLLLTLGLVSSINHNGWLFYQGGDQLWHATGAWLIAHGELPYASVGYAWSLVLAPITMFTGPGFVSALPATIVLNVVVLGPIVTLCVYWLAAVVGGRAIGLLAAALWVGLPYAAIPLFVQRYHDTYVEQVLPQAVGLTAMADYPSMVAVVVSAVLVVRSLQRRSLDDAILAGLVAGFATGVKPANYVFLAGPALAYLLARRWRLGTAFAISLLPATLALLFWKQRGLGEIPAFAMGAVRSAAGVSIPVGSYWEQLVPFDWEIFARNMDYLREFFWSNRVLQWIPFAGLLAVVRRSPPLAGLLGGWLFAYVLVKGSTPRASVERGDFWRLVMPAFPAFVILFAAILLLVPGLIARLGDRELPVVPRTLGRRSLVVAAVVLAGIPVLVTAAWRTPHTATRTVLLDDILTPIDPDIRVQAVRDGGAQRLTWNVDVPGRVFYRVYRTRAPGPDNVCAATGASRCILLMDTVATTRERSFVDGSPAPGLSYRVGVAANWLDDPEGGDVFAISDTVRAAP
jgi:hypothetical protein